MPVPEVAPLELPVAAVTDPEGALAPLAPLEPPAPAPLPFSIVVIEGEFELPQPNAKNVRTAGKPHRRTPIVVLLMLGSN
jgi:hypothetical protein